MKPKFLLRQKIPETNIKKCGRFDVRETIEKMILIITATIILIALTCCTSYSVEFQGDNIILNEEKYIQANGYFESEDKYFSKADGYKLYKIIGDENLDYVYAHSFTDGQLYVREGYEQTQNTITAVINDNRRLKYEDEAILEYFSNLSTIEMPVDEDTIEDLADNYKVIVFLQYDYQPVCNELYYIIYDEEKDEYIIYNSFGFSVYVSETYKGIVKKIYEGID